jgi:glucose uptake protein
VIIPGSYAGVLILLLLGMLGWGMWANTFKATGSKWRFELFYFDFAIGVALAATVLALTAGSLGFDGFSFTDDLRLAGKRQDFFAFGAGLIFNLGNMLLLAAASVAGLTVAFPVAMGFAVIVAAIWNFALNPGGNTAFLFIGAAVVLGAIVLDVLAFKTWSTARLPAETQPRKGKFRRKASLRGVFLSLAGGLLLGSFAPLVRMGGAGDNGLGPYSFGFVFAIGVLFSTFVFNLFFMNLPVKGEPADIGEYLRAQMKLHALGMAGGILWYTGMIATLVNGRVEGAARVAPTVSYAFAQGGIVIALLCGFFFWREFEGADATVKTRLGLMVFLLVVGIGLSAAGMAPAP